MVAGQCVAGHCVEHRWWPLRPSSLPIEGIEGPCKAPENNTVCITFSPSFTTSCKRLKMEKTPRYTQRERNMVLSYAAQYKDVIENKRTDAESNRKKDEVWLQIAKEFNSRVYHQRSAKQLRQLYKNMKLLLKKDLCGEDKSNHSFMDLLNTLSHQESVAQYIAEQLSPEGAGGGGGGGKQGGAGNGGGNGHQSDDYDDSKVGFIQICA